MLHAQQVEELLCLVSRMDRASIARQLRGIDAGFPVDFSDSFLETTDLDRLRHIFLAVCLQTKQLPAIDDGDVDVVMEHVA